MDRNLVSIIVVEHNEEPKVVEIRNHYKDMQAIVNGLFGFMPFDKANPECKLMVNDEYLMNGSELNRYVKSDYHPYPEHSTFFGVPIMGTFAVVRHNDEGEMVSVTAEDIQKYQKTFRL